jgi:hypothetical protein
MIDIQGSVQPTEAELEFKKTLWENISLRTSSISSFRLTNQRRSLPERQLAAAKNDLDSGSHCASWN